MSRSPHRALLLVACLALSVSIPSVAVAKRVVLMSFSGPQGGPAAGQVRRALQGVRYVSAGAFLSAARSEGHVGAARKLGVAAVIRGNISRLRGRWVLRVTVRSGTNQVIGRGTFSLRGARLDASTARQVARAVSRHLRRAHAPAGAARRVVRRKPRRRRRQPRVVVRKVPTPPPRRPAPVPPRRRPTRQLDVGTDLDRGDTDGGLGDEPKVRPRVARRAGGVAGFTVGADPERPDVLRDRDRDADDPPVLRRRPRRRDDNPDDGDGRRRGGRTGRQSWETIIEVFAGLNVQNRSFSFNAPVKPVNPPSYKSGVHAALSISAALYPLAAFSRNALADIGLVARYDRVVGLKSQLDVQTLADTLSQTFEVGLRYRWNILSRPTSPVVMVGLEYGRQMFFILSDTPPLPNITYDYLKLALARVEWPFYRMGDWRFGLSGAFDYLLVFSAGNIENEDSTGYGRSSTGGINGELGIFGGYQGFIVRAQFFYRRFFFDFDRLCAIQNTSCGEAGGALDVYMGATINLGYTY